ncbi:Oidioi.mRNA.OKI2018_I69.chr2.g5772.t1.cds [Oikopleura dioica]|uniref:Oidioi.mRNA.OKI2018_I69.chr2.g5772.t1.cds n=1 Tax=Oikopleura dioica TaxID=34765 RepID=A0ABN7T1B9_OIKDI|nr:Oidioi.mRNA.OKI2018_I69.chr2.g5772.t1.cds [Oikopleura dioica]
MRRLSLQLLTVTTVTLLPDQIEASEDDSRFSQEEFAFKIYNAQLKESYNQNRNFLVSPLSTYRQLHSLCLSSTGKTKKEIKEIVSCRGKVTRQLNKAFRDINDNKIKALPDVYSANGRWDLQRGYRILPNFAASPKIVDMNILIINRNFDLDEGYAIQGINHFYNAITDKLDLRHIPDMVPTEHVVKRTSRMVVTDQSIVRLPIFSSSISYRPFQNDRSGPFSSHLPVSSTVKMVTLANVMVTQIIHKRLAAQAIHLNMAVKNYKMVLIVPDGKSLDKLEGKMTPEDFKSLMSADHESDDENVMVIRECVNLTMPLIDSTYINHHLDKSVLQRYGATRLMQMRNAELWNVSPTPTAHLTSMLQRVHFELVPTTDDVLTQHKKEVKAQKKAARKSRRKSRRNRKSKSGRKNPAKSRKSRSTSEEGFFSKKTDSLGTTVTLDPQASYELMIDRSFIYALKLKDNYLQIGRYSTPTINSNTDKKNFNFSV